MYNVLTSTSTVKKETTKEPNIQDIPTPPSLPSPTESATKEKELSLLIIKKLDEHIRELDGLLAKLKEKSKQEAEPIDRFKTKCEKVVAAQKNFNTKRWACGIAKSEQKVHLRRLKKKREQENDNSEQLKENSQQKDIFEVWLQADENLKKIFELKKNIKTLEEENPKLQATLLAIQGQESQPSTPFLLEVSSSIKEAEVVNESEMLPSLVLELIEFYESLSKNSEQLGQAIERLNHDLRTIWQPAQLIEKVKTVINFLGKLERNKVINFAIESQEAAKYLDEVSQALEAQSNKLEETKNVFQKVKEQAQEVQKQLNILTEKKKILKIEQAKLNQNGQTLLRCAIKKNDYDKVVLLLKCADQTVPDSYGSLPLHLACSVENIDSRIIDCLLGDLSHKKNLASIRHRDKFGRTPLMHFKDAHTRKKGKDIEEIEEKLSNKQKFAEECVNDIILQAIKGISRHIEFIVGLINEANQAYLKGRIKEAQICHDQAINYLTDMREDSFDNNNDGNLFLPKEKKQFVHLIEECFQVMNAAAVEQNIKKIEDSAIGKFSIFIDQIRYSELSGEVKNDINKLAALFFYQTFIFPVSSPGTRQAIPFSDIIVPTKIVEEIRAKIIVDFEKKKVEKGEEKKKEKEELLEALNSFFDTITAPLTNEAPEPKDRLQGRGRSNTLPERVNSEPNMPRKYTEPPKPIVGNSSADKRLNRAAIFSSSLNSPSQKLIGRKAFSPVLGAKKNAATQPAKNISHTERPQKPESPGQTSSLPLSSKQMQKNPSTAQQQMSSVGISSVAPPISRSSPRLPNSPATFSQISLFPSKPVPVNNVSITRPGTGRVVHTRARMFDKPPLQPTDKETKIDGEKATITAFNGGK